MKSLLILRHAKSSWKHEGLSDHDRPLNRRGLYDAPRMGRLIRQHALVPDRILSSTAVRACTTAVQVAEAAGVTTPPVLLPDLYLAGPENYLDHLSRLDDGDDRVMLVGHNPGMEELLHLLTGQDESMPTAALGHVSLPIERWADLDGRSRGVLLNLWIPRELPD